MAEPQAPPPIIHIVYVKDESTGHMVINSMFKEEEEEQAFKKARECYGAFDEVAIARGQAWRP